MLLFIILINSACVRLLLQRPITLNSGKIVKHVDDCSFATAINPNNLYLELPTLLNSLYTSLRGQDTATSTEQPDTRLSGQLC